MIKNHMSIKSAEGLSDLLARMFPDSAIAHKLTLGRTKATYIINFGLAPYFTKQLKLSLKTCGPYVVCFDESLKV
jgi:hypothetical protein